MKCDICNEEFANSMELDKHKEREHPVDDSDKGLEKPDMMADQEKGAPIIPGQR